MASDDAIFGCVMVVYPMLVIVWFALSWRDIILYNENQHGVIMKVTNCNPAQVLPPAGLASFMGIKPMPVATLKESNTSSWYLEDWQFGNTRIYPHSNCEISCAQDPPVIGSYDLFEHALCPLSSKVLKVKNPQFVCAYGHATTTGSSDVPPYNGVARRKLQAGGQYPDDENCQLLSITYNARCLSSSTAPAPGAHSFHLNDPKRLVGWSYDLTSIFFADFAMLNIGFYTMGLFFPCYIVSFGLNCAKLYYLNSLLDPANLKAWQEEMFPSCTVTTVGKNDEHRSIVVFLVTSIGTIISLPFLFLLLGFCLNFFWPRHTDTTMTTAATTAAPSDSQQGSSIRQAQAHYTSITPHVVNLHFENVQAAFAHVSAKFTNSGKSTKSADEDDLPPTAVNSPLHDDDDHVQSSSSSSSSSNSSSSSSSSGGITNPLHAPRDVEKGHVAVALPVLFDAVAEPASPSSIFSIGDEMEADGYDDEL